MSRAGRPDKEAKRREVMQRIAEVTPGGDVVVPPEALLAFKAEQLYLHCRRRLIERYPSLWPPDVIGATIAEQWFQNLIRAQQQAAVDAMRARAEEAGIVLPS